MLQDSKLIFPGDNLHVQRVILQDAEIWKFTRETSNHLLDDYNDNISSSSNDIGHTKLIEMDMETKPKLSPQTSKLYTFP